MPRKEWTEEQRKAFGEKMRNARKNKDKIVASTEPGTPTKAITDESNETIAELQRRMDEIMETNQLLKAAILNGQTQQNGVQLGNQNRIVGEVDKYLVDPNEYPDPTLRLAAEPKLQTIAFNHNYELMYDFSIRSYETKTGINMREPEFLITLLRVVLDDQGNRVQIVDKDGVSKDKFYIARRLVFHEDPQAALVIARENNVAIDSENQKTFLDEMRYLRIRDWLFDFFWTKKPKSLDGVHEEAVGGTIVQVYTKSSVEPSHVDFDQLQTKV